MDFFSCEWSASRRCLQVRHPATSPFHVHFHSHSFALQADKRRWTFHSFSSLLWNTASDSKVSGAPKEERLSTTRHHVFSILIHIAVMGKWPVLECSEFIYFMAWGGRGTDSFSLTTSLPSPPPTVLKKDGGRVSEEQSKLRVGRNIQDARICFIHVAN